MANPIAGCPKVKKSFKTALKLDYFLYSNEIVFNLMMVV
jgi:hypothetical protein